jgi:alanine dehydrogenase
VNAIAIPSMTFGFPRQCKERGERRDFLPGLIRTVAHRGCPVLVETGIGSGMGYTDAEYLAMSPLVEITNARGAFSADVVVTLRAPDDLLDLLRPGATLVSMLHFPTRPGRIERLASMGLEAIALDCIIDDDGRRLVENMRSVGWNGLETAFDALSRTLPGLTDRSRGPIRVTVLGAGEVGKHAIEAATKYGSLERDRTFAELRLPGVVVSVVGRNVTARFADMRELLAHTDVLVDATQRSDASRPVIPNRWLAALPAGAVICDLVVDPYQPDTTPPTVRGIEGIPQGDLDQWTFFPDDPAWERTIPPGVSTRHRRTVVSCYSWPGIHPEACMRRYERQLAPLLEALIERGGVRGLRADHGVLDRALRRASLRSWTTAGAESEMHREAAPVGATAHA